MKNTNLNLDIRLSEHFSLREMVRSCRSVQLGIDNTPDAATIERLRQLCIHVLEPLRCQFGVLRITSGYRCQALNKAVGGSPTSQHLRGEAADVHLSSQDVTQKMLRFLADGIDFDQAIVEHNRRTGARWLHLSYSTRHKNRRMIFSITK